MVNNKLKFYELSKEHFTIVTNWFNQPHVQEYYSLPNWTHQEVATKLSKYLSNESDVKAYIIAINNQSIGYIQKYPLKNHPWPDQEFNEEVIDNTAGIDFFIGELDYVGKGLGTKILEGFLNNYIWPNYNYCVADPDTNNSRSINFLKKLGFIEEKIIHTKNAINQVVALQLMLKTK